MGVTPDGREGAGVVEDEFGVCGRAGAVLRFELAPDASGHGCVLDLTVTFVEPGKGARDAAGWHVSLERLGHVVDGRALPGDPPDRWRALHAHYRRRLGPEASVIGPPVEWRETYGAADAAS